MSVEPAEEAFRALELEFSLLLRRARARTAELARTIHPGLDGASYALLRLVADSDGVRARDVAAAFGVDKAAISRQVARLEVLGLLERRPDPADARGQLLAASAEGRQRVERASADRRVRFRGQLVGWTTEDVATLAELLGRLNRTRTPPTS